MIKVRRSKNPYWSWGRYYCKRTKNTLIVYRFSSIGNDVTSIGFCPTWVAANATSLVTNSFVSDWHEEAIVLNKVSFGLTKEAFGCLQDAFE